jgi:hypothetical protein
MLLLARKDGRVQGYVGQTTDPRARLLQHCHKPQYLLARVLQADDLNINSVAFIPLEVVPLAHKDDSGAYGARSTLRLHCPRPVYREVIADAAAGFSPCPCAEAIVVSSDRSNPRPFGFI